MQGPLSAFSANPAAAIIGLAAMVCLAIWPLFRGRSAMLTAYLGNNIGFAVHYGLLDHWTAVAMNGLMGAQTIVAVSILRWPRLRWVYLGFVPLLAGASFVTWQGIPSLLAATATALSTIARMQTRETLLRVLLLSAMPFWAAHDLIVGSLPGLTADLISMATGATMLLRGSQAIRAVSWLAGLQFGRWHLSH